MEYQEHQGSHSTNLTPTGLADQLVDEITSLADMILDLDLQKIVKSYCDIILQNRSAISDATHLLPLETALFLIQATVHQNNKHEINDLYNEFNQRIHDLRDENSALRGEVEELKNLLNAET